MAQAPIKTPSALPAKTIVPPKPITGSPKSAPTPTPTPTPPSAQSQPTTARPQTAQPAGAMRPAPGAAAQALAAKPQGPAFKIEEGRLRAKYLKLLVYGEYGTGKTFLMGTASDVPSMCDVLLINAESGDLTLVADGHNFDAIDSVRVTTFKQVSRVYEFLKLHCQLRDSVENKDKELRNLEAQFKGVKPDDIDKPNRYRTCIIDSLTEIEVYCLYQLLGITDLTRLDEEVASPEWAEYKRQMSMVQRMIRGFRDLPMHILMSCARNYTQDEQKRFTYGPSMTGQLSRNVQGFMDMVGYLTMGMAIGEEGAAADQKKIPRRMYIQPIGRFAAKSRFSTYKSNWFDDATMPSILRAVGLDPGK